MYNISSQHCIRCTKYASAIDQAVILRRRSNFAQYHCWYCRQLKVDQLKTVPSQKYERNHKRLPCLVSFVILITKYLVVMKNVFRVVRV